MTYGLRFTTSFPLFSSHGLDCLCRHRKAEGLRFNVCKASHGVDFAQQSLTLLKADAEELLQRGGLVP